ncbi:ferritin [Plakobranchus ocellatus]|uniref:Ferritin n=1 Tax=Plakobranchus ocellatus TaxID=259542 RepID=A0AAV4CWD3_9GAST|nr:ferritin [Plakobranchus ocellatus]
MYLLFLLHMLLLASISVQQEAVVSMVAQNYNPKLDSQLEQQISSYVTQEVAYTAYASYFERADVALPGFEKFFSSLSKSARESAKNMTRLVNERGGCLNYPIIQLKYACEKIEKELAKGNISKPMDVQSVIAAPPRRNPHICHFLLVHNPFDSLKKKHHKSSKKHYKTTKKPKKHHKRTYRSRKSRSYDYRNVRATSPSTHEPREKWQHGLYGLEDALALERTVMSEILKTHNDAAFFKDPLTRHRLEHYLENQIDSVYQVAQLVDRLQQHRNLDTYILEEYLLDSHLQEM